MARMLKFLVTVVLAAVAGTLACAVVMRLMSGEFRPELAGAVGGAAGAAAAIATGNGRAKQPGDDQ